MTSLDEVRTVLHGVVEQVRAAHALADTARTGIAEALAALERLGAQNGQPLPPPQLVRAVDELDRGIGLIRAGDAAVTDITARL